MAYVGDVASHCKVVLKSSVKKDGLYRWSGNGIYLNPTNTIIVSVKLCVGSVQICEFPNKYWFPSIFSDAASSILHLFYGNIVHSENPIDDQHPLMVN